MCCYYCAFSALTLLVGHQEEYMACKKLSGDAGLPSLSWKRGRETGVLSVLSCVKIRIQASESQCDGSGTTCFRILAM